MTSGSGVLSIVQLLLRHELYHLMNLVYEERLNDKEKMKWKGREREG